MKWQYLLWSVVFIGILTLLFARISSMSTSALGEDFAFFSYAFITWVCICIASPVILVFRLIRVIKRSDSFVYILMGTSNLAIGAMGIYFILSSHPATLGFYFIIFIINLSVAGFVCWDAFFKEIPGFKK
jgi:hypothetical protein